MNFHKRRVSTQALFVDSFGQIVNDSFDKSIVIVAIPFCSEMTDYKTKAMKR